MKPKIENSPLVTSTGMNDGSVMGMTIEAALEMTKHLRDTVYKNKPLAVVRELATNALDEHSVHNVDQEVVISLQPNDQNDYDLKVRDYALGLSEEGVRTIFGMYGNSTKRTTNKASGMLGIGAKSPFCYTDAYYVVSYFGGKKTTYSCSLGGDEGGRSVGHIHILSVEDSNEPTGLEVVVPVQSIDHHKFHKEMQKFVEFCPHKIVYQTGELEYRPMEVLKEEKFDGFTLRKLNGADRDYSSNLIHFQMGGVLYETLELPKHGNCQADTYLVVDADIGKMKVALSRESFQDTKEDQLFKEKVKDKLEEIFEGDFAIVKNIPFDQVVQDTLLNGMKKVDGEWFSSYTSFLHADVWEVLGNIYVDNDSATSVYEQNNKPVLALNHAETYSSYFQYWRDKATDLMRDKDCKLYSVQEGRFARLTDAAKAKLETYFHVQQIKKLPYPKAASKNGIGGRYLVHFSSRRLGKLTALETVQWFYRRQTGNDAPFSNEKDARKWLKNYKKNVNTLEDLNDCVVRATTDYYSHSFRCSKAMKKQLVSMGFYEANDRELQRRIQKLQAENARKRAIEETIRQAYEKLTWVRVNERTRQLIKDEKHAKRFNEFWTQVFKEDSLRCKLIKTVANNRDYYTKVVLNRDELRRTLKLK